MYIFRNIEGIEMDRRIFYVSLVLLVALFLFVDPAYCGITDANIKNASKTFTATMNDWMPAIIGTGLFGSGVALFMNNFKMGLTGLVGTGFLYASKAFVGTGEGALIHAAEHLLKAVS